MGIRRVSSRARCALIAGFYAVSSLPAQAQKPDAGRVGNEPLEEVLVTARQRSEALIEIPLSITAFSDEQIRERGFRDLSDLLRHTSSVDFNVRGGGGGGGVGGRVNPVIRIRGVSSLGGLPHLQASSLFIDGVFALGGANVIPINNIERVEVIKGPQSAYFGRNTFAGAINCITRTPSLSERETLVDISAGNHSTFDVSLLSSFPLIDEKLAIEGNIRYYDRGAQYRATDGGALGEENTRSASLTLYAKPTESLSIKAHLDYQEDDDGLPAVAFFQAQLLAPTCQGRQVPGLDNLGNPTTITLGAFWCGRVPEQGEAFAPRITSNTLIRPASFSFVRPAFDGETNQTLPAAARPDFLIQQGLVRKYLPGVPTLDGPGMRRDYLRAALKVDYEFGGGYTLGLIGGMNDQKTNYLYDFDRTDVESWWTIDPQTAEDFSVELRLSSPGDRRFRWLVGATYYDQEFVASGAGGLAISSCPLAAPTPAAQAACLTANSVGPGNFALATTSGNDATVRAIYGSVSYDFNDRWTLDLEGRYLKDERVVPLVAGTFRQDFGTTYDQRTPRVILRYRPNEDTTLYAQASRGALPGQTVGIVATCSAQDFLVPYVSPITGQPSTPAQAGNWMRTNSAGNSRRSTAGSGSTRRRTGTSGPILLQR